MSRLLIRNGRVIDPSQNLDAEVGEIECLIEDGRITDLGGLMNVEMTLEGACFEGNRGVGGAGDGPHISPE